MRRTDPATTYGPARIFDGNASTFYIAANNTGGARGQMGYIFPSPVAPVECRITARNDAYFGDNPQDLAIQWCADRIHGHTTDSRRGSRGAVDRQGRSRACSEHDDASHYDPRQVHRRGSGLIEPEGDCSAECDGAEDRHCHFAIREFGHPRASAARHAQSSPRQSRIDIRNRSTSRAALARRGARKGSSFQLRGRRPTPPCAADPASAKMIGRNPCHPARLTASCFADERRAAEPTRAPLVSRSTARGLDWIRGYAPASLRVDILAGITLAAYAIPVALAYATLAGLPPQMGIYGYLLGGLGYALLGSSRHLAIGPTSAISLMVGASVATMAAGNPVLHTAIASLTAFAVAVICFVAWAARLSVLVKLISDSVLVGFRFGAGLTIAMTQLPNLFGVAGGGHDFISRAWALLGQLGGINPYAFGLGLMAIAALVAGGRFLPGRPVGLAVVVVAIASASLLGLSSHGVAVTGPIPPGLPELALPPLWIVDVPDLFPLAAGCVLLAYVEGVSAARSFAEKHDYAIDPRREFLGLGGANLLAAMGHGYPVAGGLSQSAVNETAGARSRVSLVVASGTLAICLLFLTGPLANLPKAALAAIVLTAVAGLIDLPAMLRLYRVSRFDFIAAGCALLGVLLLGILEGVLLATVASALALIMRSTKPHVAFLGRIPGTARYGDRAHHPEAEALPGILLVRPEGPLIYLGAEHIEATILDAVDAEAKRELHAVVCDLSATPNMDVAGTQMLHKLAGTLSSRGIALSLVGAHARVRHMLSADGLTMQGARDGQAISLAGEVERIEALIPVSVHAGTERRSG